MARLIQQINLYQPRFRREAKAFSLNTLLLILGLAVLVMAGIYGFGQWQLSELQRQMAALNGQHVELQKRVAQMRQLLPEPSVNQEFEQELARLQIERSSGYALLNMLEGRMTGNGQGFSGYFVGLARQSEPGIWLEAVDLNAAGNYFALKGKVINPELLPQFLQKLEQEPAFENKAFRVVRMLREDPAVDQVSFDLKTETVKQE